MSWKLVLVVLFALAEQAYCLRKLGRYKVDRSRISVSGLSGGEAMATQVHVAYSSVFMGVGVLAGMPYYMALDSYSYSTMLEYILNPELLNVRAMVNQTRKFESYGMIDSTRNMRTDRVFIYHGINDTAVVPGVGKKTLEYYNNFVDSSNIKTVFNLSTPHTFPTSHYGNCEFAPPYIGNCNYNGAYETLQHIYGNLKLIFGLHTTYTV